MKIKINYSLKDFQLISKKSVRYIKVILLFLIFGIIPPLITNPMNFDKLLSSFEEEASDQDQYDSNIDYETLFNEWDKKNKINSDFKENFAINGYQSLNFSQIPQGPSILPLLSDNQNEYLDTWSPWTTKGSRHIVKISPDGDFLVTAGGYLLDNTIHIYRWDNYKREYVKTWEAGSEEISGDVYDLSFGDSDNNNLIEVAAASADGHVYLFEQAHVKDPITNLESRLDLVWTSDSFKQQVTSVEFFDADLDKKTDLIVGSWNKKVTLFEHLSSSDYPFTGEHTKVLRETWTSPELDSQVQSIGTGDFDGNGLPEFVVSTFTGSVYVFENEGVGIDIGNGEYALIPYNDHYKLKWNSTGNFRPIWNPIICSETGYFEEIQRSIAVLIAWGQGSWILQWTQEKGYFLEQLLRPILEWEGRGIYPIDVWADFLVADLSENIYQNDTLVLEGVFGFPNIAKNSGGTGSPDQRYSRFVSNETDPAIGVWDMGSTEAIAANGNQDPDVYVIFPLDVNNISTLDIENWSFAISNDKKSFIDIDNSELTIVKGNNSNFESIGINIDKIFAINHLLEARYIKITLKSPSIGSQERYLESILTPYVARPLTLATSVTIGSLAFSRTELTTKKRIIFGGVEGRILAFEYDNITGFNGNFLMDTLPGSGSAVFAILNATHIKYEYGLKTSEFIQVWDSYTSYERFNLEKTIWTITQTPKTGFIPSWTFFEFDDRTQDVPLQNDWFEFEGIMESGEIHHMTNIPATNFEGVNKDFFDFDSYDINEIVALTSDKYPRIYLMGFNNYNQFEEVTSDLNGKKWTELLLLNVNDFFGNNMSYLTSEYYNFILTTAFGELNANSNGSELLTFPWYKDHIFTGSVLPDDRLVPLLWKQNITEGLSIFNSSVFAPEPLDNLIEDTQVNIFRDFLFSSSTYPSGAMGDMDSDGDTDIIISNGDFLLLENIGNSSYPHFSLNFDYFQELNQKSPSLPLFSPQVWDHNLDGYLDIAYSYGLVNGTRRPGVDFFINEGPNDRGEYGWSRFSQMFNNQFNSSIPYPASISYNNYSLGTLFPTIDDPSTPDIDERYISSGTSFWIYREDQKTLRKLYPNIEKSSSFMIGTNPELMKLEINKFQDPPWVINMGFSISKSWDNSAELSNWTLALAGGNLDLDNQNEVIVADFDNNVYIFEHILNNTYKRAYKTPDLIQMEETDFSPYKWEDLPGVEAQLSPFGKFIKTNYKHADLVAAGLDSDIDGKKEFVVAAGLILYVFENTGIDDEYELILNYDIRDTLNLPDNSSKKITALAITNEFDGRGGMIALAMENYLFLLRNDPLFGWLESFQVGSQFLNLEFSQSSLLIQTLAFFDLNQDDQVELWMGGTNSTQGENGFLVALQSDFGNIYWVYSVPTRITDNSPITDIKIADSNYNDLNEIVIAHKNGIDIWEANKGNPIVLSQLNSLSGSPTYQTSTDIAFEPYRANTTLGKRSNVFQKINSTHYLVIFSGNDGLESTPWDSAIQPSGEGSLYYEIVDDPSINLENEQAQWKDLSPLGYNDTSLYEIYQNSANSPACTAWSDTNYWDSQLGDIIETIDGGSLSSVGTYYYKKHLGTGYQNTPFQSTDLVCFARRPVGQYVPKVVQGDNGTSYVAWIRSYENVLVDLNGGIIGNKVLPITGNYAVDLCTSTSTTVPVIDKVYKKFSYTYKVLVIIGWILIIPIFGWITKTGYYYEWVYEQVGTKDIYQQSCVK
ncbi:MAG: hypothetical protein ACFFD1_02925 [Candidatus Thorarchaeota archaeon]